MRHLVLVVLLAATCTNASAHGQTLTIAYHQGDVQMHSLHVIADGMLNQYLLNLPTRLDLTARETVTVSSVDDAGAVDVLAELTNLDLHSDVNVTAPTTNSQKVRFSPEGRILTVSALDSMQGFGLVFTGWTVRAIPNGAWLTDIASVLPAHAVKPGDSWTKNYVEPTPFNSSGTLGIAAKGTYLRDESFQGVSTAVVETTSTTSIAATLDASKVPAANVSYSFIEYKGTTTSVITAWIDPNAHRIVESHMTSKTDVTMTFLDASGATGTGVLGPMSIKNAETADLLPFKS